MLRGIELGKGALSFSWDNPSGGSSDMKNQISYFYTALSVPEKDWWVNLGISLSEKDIISLALAKTKLGYVLLNADLKMKAIVNKVMSPNTNSGADFWEEVNRLGVDGFSPKFWMVPGDTDIVSSGSKVFIRNAKVRVRVEVEDGFPEGISRRLHSLLEKYVVTKVERAINTSSDFSEFRAAYYAMILASWTKANAKSPALQSVVNSYITPDVGVLNIARYDFLVAFARHYMFSNGSAANFSVTGGGFDGRGIKDEVEESTVQVTEANMPSGSGVSNLAIPDKVDNKQCIDYSERLGLNIGSHAFGIGEISFGEGVSPDDFGTNVVFYNGTAKPMVITKEMVDKYRLEESLGRGKVIGLHLVQFIDENGNAKIEAVSYFENPKDITSNMKDGDVIAWMVNAYDIAGYMSDYIDGLIDSGKINDVLAQLNAMYDDALINKDMRNRIIKNVEKRKKHESLTPIDVVGLMYGLRAADRLPDKSMRLIKNIFPGINLTEVDQGNFNSISSTLVRDFPEYGFLMPLISFELAHKYLRVFRWEGRSLDSKALEKANDILLKLEKISSDHKLGAVLGEIKAIVKKGMLQNTDIPVGDFLHALDLGVPSVKNGEIEKSPEGKVVIKTPGLLALIGDLSTEKSKKLKRFIRDNLIDFMNGFYREIFEEKIGLQKPYDEEGRFSVEKAKSNLGRLVEGVENEFVGGKSFEEIKSEAENVVTELEEEDVLTAEESKEILEKIKEMSELYNSNSKLSDSLKIWLDKTFPKNMLGKDSRLKVVVNLYAAVYFNFFRKNILPKMYFGIKNVGKYKNSNYNVAIFSYEPGKSDPAHWGHLQAFFESMSDFVYFSVPTNDNGDPNKPMLTTFFDRMYFPIMMQYLYGDMVLNEMKQAKDIDYYYTIGEKLFPVLVEKFISNSKESGVVYPIFFNYFFGVDHLRVTKSGGRGVNSKVADAYQRVGFAKVLEENGQVLFYNRASDLYLVTDDNIGCARLFSGKEGLLKLGYSEKKLSLQAKGPDEVYDDLVDEVLDINGVIEHIVKSPDIFAEKYNIDNQIILMLKEAIEKGVLKENDVASLPFISILLSPTQETDAITANAENFLNEVNGNNDIAKPESEDIEKKAGGLLLAPLAITVR